MKKILSAASILLLTLSQAFAADVADAGPFSPGYQIYPVPRVQQVVPGKAAFATVNIVAGPDIDEATVRRAVEIFDDKGIKSVTSDKYLGGRSNVLLGVNGSGDKADKAAGKAGLDRSVFSLPKYDRHVLSLTADKDGKAQVVLVGENTDAVFCGLASLEQILDNGTEGLTCVNIYDCADIRDRGIIEGYYGVPYSAEVTKDLFRFMARYKMNTYMYGAKSDPYHSRYWSDPYPETITEEQRRIGYLSADMMKEITAVAHASKVNFIWAIHPGTAFTDAVDEDVNSRIMQKFESMYELGVRQFGVFVDDVGVPSDPAVLKLGADRLADLQSRVDRKLGGRPLHYVPQLYAYSWVSEDVARNFFQSLSGTPEKINVYITGRAVWTVPNNEDLAKVRDFLGRGTSWWWNYPCNDNDMTKLFPMDIYSNFKDERHIDNLARLENLDGATTLIINPMQQGEISKITLFSVADYAWNNSAFDNQRSWEAALPAVIGKDKAPALRYLAPYLRYFDADALGYDVREYKASVERGHPRPGTIIFKLLGVRKACSQLMALKDSEDISDRLFYSDIRPWLLKLDAMAAEAVVLLQGKPSAGTDFENSKDFQFEVLNGMGEDISLSVLTAEPAAEVLRPFIDYLKQLQEK